MGILASSTADDKLLHSIIVMVNTQLFLRQTHIGFTRLKGANPIYFMRFPSIHTQNMQPSQAVLTITSTSIPSTK